MQTEVFDGSGDFHLWQDWVENELVIHGLLGYVRLKNYDGSQALAYQGDEIPGKTSEGLSKQVVMQERAQAKKVLNKAVHSSLQSLILGRNVYDSWATLCAAYGKSRSLQSGDLYAMNRAVQSMFLHEKEGESAEEFIARWKMVVDHYVLVTGSQLSDAYLSGQLELTLPKTWKATVDSWRTGRLFVPLDELVKKIIEKGKDRRVDGARKEYNTKAEGGGDTTAKKCFYCLRTTHEFRGCRYLSEDIKANNTHNCKKGYSCRVTPERKQWMVDALEKYIKSISSSSSARRSPSRARSAPFQHSRSVLDRLEERRPVRASRSQNVRRGQESNGGFYFPPRKRQRSPSFERAFRSSP